MSKRLQHHGAGISLIAKSFVVVLLLCGSAWAQSTASADLLGTVTDSTGAVIPGVALTVTEEATGVTTKTTSNEVGYYAFKFLPVGRYRLTAEKDGFSKVTVTDIVLRVSVNLTVPIVMQPGVVTETMIVMAESNQIDMTSATLKYTVTNEQVRGLPVFTTTTGRTVLDQLPFLVPGVIPAATLGGDNRGWYMSINGSRRQAQSFNFQGGDNNDPEFQRAASTLPNPDALQEFTVLTNNYQADQGRTSGGIINATTKSGTNEFHGNLRYFNRNDAFNARGFFDPKRPRQNLHTFGGQVGGPVRLPWLYKGKDQTHFFFDYEGTRSQRDSIYSANLLTVGERSGDFSDQAQSQWPRDPLTGQPFPGGIIPPDRINPISRRYLEFIPIPNTDARRYTEFIPSKDDNNQYTITIDHKISDSDTISGTYFATFSDQITSSTTNLPIPSVQPGEQRNHNFILRETHLFSSRTVNQFIGTVTRFTHHFTIESPKIRGITPADFGFTNVTPQTDRFIAPPAVVVSAPVFVQIGPISGTENYKTTWQITDDLSHTHGNHALKFGGEVRQFLFNKISANNNGSFNFNGSTNTLGTRNSVADFLLGVINSYSQNTGQSYYPRQYALFFYGMDDWRVRPNLTFNFGLRYEFVPPLVDQLDQFSVFRPGAKSQRLPQAPTGMLFVGDPDPILGTVPRGTYPADKNNFAPRIGIAWSPEAESGWLRTLLGDRKTSIRVGWGVFYEAMYGFSASQNTATQPWSVSLTRNATTINQAGGTFADPWGSDPNPFPLDLSRRNFTGIIAIQPISPFYRTSYTYQYNLTIQRELPGSLLFEVGYVGSNSFKLNTEEQLNPAIVGPGATPANTQQRRIYPAFSSLPQQVSAGRGHFDSLQTRLSRRFRAGLMLDASYVWSKSLDNISEPQVSQLGNVREARWAAGAFDRRHNFVVSYTYDFPHTGYSGVVGRLLNGWSIGGITQFRTGLPLEIGQSPDPTLTGANVSPAGAAGFGSTDYVGPWRRLDPRQTQTIVYEGRTLTGNFFFDPRAFQTIVIGDWTQAREGNLGRHVFYGPGNNQWDATFIKRTQIAENHMVEIRADVINLFNHAQFLVPAGQLTTSSTFGQVSRSSFGSGRNIQMSLRYTF